MIKSKGEMDQIGGFKT